MRELTLSDRDGRERKTVTPGPVSGAGPEESDTDSVSSSDEHRDNVTLTPPRQQKLFVLNSQQQTYLTSLIII